MEISNQKTLQRGIPKTKIRGLGDLIKWTLGLVGFHSCAACERRRAWLNRVFPFRRMTPQERVNKAMRQLHSIPIDDDVRAALHLRYKEDIHIFRKAFGQKFEELARDEDKRFQILFFGDDILHCALTPTPHTKVKIRHGDRKQIEKEVKEKTKWKRIKWYA